MKKTAVLLSLLLLFSSTAYGFTDSDAVPDETEPVVSSEQSVVEDENETVTVENESETDEAENGEDVVSDPEPDKGEPDEFILPDTIDEDEAKENNYVGRDYEAEQKANNMGVFVFRNADGSNTLRAFG